MRDAEAAALVTPRITIRAFRRLLTFEVILSGRVLHTNLLAIPQKRWNRMLSRLANSPWRACAWRWLFLSWLPVPFGPSGSRRRAPGFWGDVKFLASDELEGRGVGTEGLDKAAEYIRDAFAAAGLDVTVEGGMRIRNSR